MAEVLTDKQPDYSHRADHLEEHKWQPGQSGNSAGRPAKDNCITSLVKELLEQDAGDGKTNARLIAEEVVKLCKDSKQGKAFVTGLKEVLDRTEGKVPDQSNIKLDVPVTITYNLVEPKQLNGGDA